jgi:hypothetical protein
MQPLEDGLNSPSEYICVRLKDRAPGCRQALSPGKKTADLQRFYGASRTRTGDLLGAISALSGPEFGLTSGFPTLRVGSPNTFPNTLQPDLQSHNAQCCRHKRPPASMDPASIPHESPGFAATLRSHSARSSLPSRADPARPLPGGREEPDDRPRGAAGAAPLMPYAVPLGERRHDRAVVGVVRDRARS